MGTDCGSKLQLSGLEDWWSREPVLIIFIIHLIIQPLFIYIWFVFWLLKKRKKMRLYCDHLKLSRCHVSQNSFTLQKPDGPDKNPVITTIIISHHTIFHYFLLVFIFLSKAGVKTQICIIANFLWLVLSRNYSTLASHHQHHTSRQVKSPQLTFQFRLSFAVSHAGKA